MRDSVHFQHPQVDATRAISNNAPAAFNSAAGFDSPNTQADDTAPAVFLRPYHATRAPSMAGRGGEPSGCRFPVSGLLTLPRACHPRLTAGGGSNPTQEAPMPKLAHALARLFPAAVRTVARFPIESEAISFARAYLAQTGRAVRVAPAAAGFDVVTMGGAA